MVHSQIVDKFPNLSEPQVSSFVKVSRTNDTYLAWLSWDWVGKCVKNITDLVYRMPKVLIASPSQRSHLMYSVFPCQQGYFYECWMQLTLLIRKEAGAHASDSSQLCVIHSVQRQTPFPTWKLWSEAWRTPWAWSWFFHFSQVLPCVSLFTVMVISPGVPESQYWCNSHV